MPPTFLLVAFLVLLALLAPLVLVAAAAMTLRPRTRRAGIRALSAGLAGSVALIAADLALNLAMEGSASAATAEGLLFSVGLGFSAGVCWRVAASLKMRSRSPRA